MAEGAAPLKEFRKSIDNLDATLIYVLAERFRLTKRVGEFKRDKGLPSSDKGREAEQIARLKALAIDADLDPDFAERFLRFVIDEVICHHERIKSETG
jgi:chorismate mutase